MGDEAEVSGVSRLPARAVTAAIPVRIVSLHFWDAGFDALCLYPGRIDEGPK